MKKLLTLLLAAALMAPAAAADTTDDDPAPSGRDSDAGLCPACSGGHGVCRVVLGSGAYVGALIPTDAPAGLGTLMEAGIDAVAFTVTPRWRGPFLQVGAGINIKMLAMNGGYCFGKDADRLVVEPVAEGRQGRRGHLRQFGLHFPVLIKQRAGAWRFWAGAVLNLNTYASATASWSEGSQIYTNTYKGLHQRAFTADITAGLSCQQAGVYVRYSPMTAFSEAAGPQFKTLAVGMYVGF